MLRMNKKLQQLQKISFMEQTYRPALTKLPELAGTICSTGAELTAKEIPQKLTKLAYKLYYYIDHQRNHRPANKKIPKLTSCINGSPARVTR